MKLKYDFAINQVADKMVAVPIGNALESFSGFIKMNDVGAQIFEILKNDVTPEQVIELMLEKHPEATRQEAEQTITEFIAKLKDAGVLTNE